MLRTLLAKDLRRAWRNPVPLLISLGIPFVITGLVGAIFGPGGGGGGIGRIEIAFVDEDDTALTEFLQSSLEQMRTGDTKAQPPFELETQVLARDEAMRLLTENRLAAAVILPEGFTDGLLRNDQAVTIEFVKNPARAIQPRVVEEMLGLLVTVLNAFRDLGGDQLGEVRALVESDDDLLTKAALAGGMLVEARERLGPVKVYVAPPLIGYDEEKRADNAAKKPSSNIFAYLMAGMSAMFLLYLADHAMRDLYREAHARTLERFQTLRNELFVFICSKVVFAVAVSLIGSVILFGGAAVIFQFAWQRPFPVAVLVLVYTFCGAGMMGFLGALAGAERRADVMNNIIVMGLALAGGCMFPPEVFPPFLRENVTPLMPTGWFAGAVRALQSGDPSGAWMIAAAKLALLGLVTIVGATFLFRHRLEQGVRT